MEAPRAVFVEHGVSTFAVLFGSWAAYTAAFELLERLHILPWGPVKRCQSRTPPQSDSPELRARAWSMVQRIWALIFFLSLCGAPVMQRLFPTCQDALAEASTSTSYISFLALRIALAFLVDDLWFYWYHRVLHENKKLYALFHKPHHAFTQPFSWTSHAVHPVEMLLQSVGGVGGPLVAGFLLNAPFTRYEFYVWLALRQLAGVVDHCGFTIGFGRAKFHDLHHEHFICNYASFFESYDRIFGTDFETWHLARHVRTETRNKPLTNKKKV